MIDQLNFPLSSNEPLDRIRLLRDQDVGTIICGGVQDVFENIVRAHGIEIIAWVSGAVDDLVGLYLRGQLVPGAGRADQPDFGSSTQT